MIRTCLTSIAAAAALTLAAPFVSAQDLPNVKTAQKMLFSTRAKAVSVRVLNQALMAGIDAKQIKANAPYYSSFAVSPSSGFSGAGASAALNFHSIEAANEVAVSGCNKKKKSDEKDCVIVMEVVPAKYKGRVSFQLNGTATDAFKKAYKRGKTPKAFATSEDTGEWGYGVGAATPEAARTAAIAQCRQKVKAAGGTGESCAVVSEE